MKIEQLSLTSGSTLGGDEVWMRCAIDGKTSAWTVTFSTDEWTADGVVSSFADGLVIVTTPMKEAGGTVNLQLHQGEEASNAVQFTYVAEGEFL